ncbi:major facilitator superfamily domain-containing protein [Haematococcus lacustris]
MLRRRLPRSIAALQREHQSQPLIGRWGQPSSSLQNPSKQRTSEDTFMMLAKAYYATTCGAGVFLFPYITLYLSDLGASAQMVGLLCALRPWLGMISSMVGPALADRLGCHRAMLLVCFGVSSLLRLAMCLPGGIAQVAALLLAADLLLAPVGPMADSIIMQQCKQESDWGRQRVWGSIAWGGLAPLAGWLVERHGMSAGFTGFALLAMPALLIVSALHQPRLALPDLLPSPWDAKQLTALAPAQETLPHASAMPPTKPGATLLPHPDLVEGTSSLIRRRQGPAPSGPDQASLAQAPASSEPVQASSAALASCSNSDSVSFAEGMAQLLGKVEVWQLLLQCLASGLGAGLIGTYLFLYARELGASTALMGMLLFTDCASETPIFYLQDRIMAVMSPSAMMNLALGAMVVRLLLYGAVPAMHNASAWGMLPIELLQGLTLAVAWSAVTVQSKRLAPPGLTATMQGLSTAVLGGLGCGAGGLLGGMMLDANLGWSATWTASAAVVAGLWGLSLAAPSAHHHLMARKLQ